MWKHIPISSSEAILFDRMDVILAIARTMKTCHYFYLSKEDYKIYGCNEEFYAIHSISLNPQMFEIPCSIMFNILSLDSNLIGVYKSFILYKNMPWVMFPAEDLNEHYKYKVIYTSDEIGFTVKDDMGNRVEHLALYPLNREPCRNNQIMLMLNNKKILEPFLGESQFFGNKESDPLIQEVFTTKATEGARYMRLTNMHGKNYGFMLFKNLFNMNKADSLTIIIRDRIDMPNLYEATFVTAKKKSPIPDILPSYVESTHVMFMNI